MAYCYVKPDEKNGANKRWYAAVLSPSGSQVRVSLRLEAPGNRRLAEKRTSDLQYEADRGALSPATISWLGSSAARVAAAITTSTHVAREPWPDAAELFLAACPGSGHAAVNRAAACRKFAAHAHASGHAPAHEPAPAVREWLASELARGQSPVTVKGTSLAYVSVMLGWLAASGRSPKLDRAAVAGVIPRKPAKKLALPSHAEDLEFLRLASSRRSREWAIAVLARGLGCRPSEAVAMQWEDVDLTPGSESVRVSGKDSKITGTSARTAPVLWAWAVEALSAIRRDEGPVCVRACGKPWKGQSGYLRALAEATAVKPKQAQKLGIMQMVQAGFPAHVVAHWTGHTLSVQERHYMTDGAYLPSDRDFGEFGRLSAHGERALSLHQGGNKRGNI